MFCIDMFCIYFGHACDFNKSKKMLKPAKTVLLDRFLIVTDKVLDLG